MKLINLSYKVGKSQIEVKNVFKSHDDRFVRKEDLP